MEAPPDLSAARARPGVAEWLLVAFCALAGLGLYVAYWNGEFAWSVDPTNYTNPFARYYANVGVRAITIAAYAVDAGIVLTVVGWAVRRAPASTTLRILLGLCLLGAAIIWVELWYGSTFYYGEVRDKQGLPFGVNNGGPLGSVAFLAFVAWRSLPRMVIRLATLPVLITGHWLLLRLLEESWQLWQS
jgi:hypothetical protein